MKRLLSPATTQSVRVIRNRQRHPMTDSKYTIDAGDWPHATTGNAVATEHSKGESA